MLRLLGWIMVIFCFLVICISSILLDIRQEESTLVFIAYEITGLSQDSVHVFHPETGKDWLVSDNTSTSSPTWSPDGKWLIFSMGHNNDMDLVKVNTQGTQRQWLTNTPNSYENEGYWSPNGKWIIFAYSNIMRIDADGENQIALFAVEKSDFAWSPDSSKIAFTSTHETGEPVGINQPRPIRSLYVMDADGQSAFRLTPSFDSVSSFNWSPDSDWIVFSAYQNDNHDLYKIRSDGSQLQNLTQNIMRETAPKWSPDGKYIVFKSEYHFHLIDSDGSNPIQLTENTQSSIYTLTWMPNSQEIVFLVNGRAIRKIGLDSMQITYETPALKQLDWGGMNGMAVSPPIEYDWHSRRLILGAGCGLLFLLGVGYWQRSKGNGLA